MSSTSVTLSSKQDGDTAFYFDTVLRYVAGRGYFLSVYRRRHEILANGQAIILTGWNDEQSRELVKEAQRFSTATLAKLATQYA